MLFSWSIANFSLLSYNKSETLPLIPLGYELKHRGHQVTLIGTLDAKEITEAAGLNFIAYAEKSRPLGFTPNTLVKMGELSGLASLKYSIELFRQSAIAMMKEGLESVREAKAHIPLVMEGDKQLRNRHREEIVALASRRKEI